jgi:hypothetical protein
MQVQLRPARLLFVISTPHSNTSGIDQALGITTGFEKELRQQAKGEEAVVAETLPPWLRQLRLTRYFEHHLAEMGIDCSC